MPNQKTRHLSLRERIEYYSTPITECGCWIWMGCISSGGYGSLKFAGMNDTAHRWSWVAHFGDIPPGLDVMHSCDIRTCVNPDHLSLGTRLDNVMDMDRKGRRGEFNRQGEFNGNSKLYEDDVKIIRASAEPRSRLAERFNVAWITIWEIQTGRSWAHLKENGVHP